jgi:predicted 2-oxoglutarate/Fe(II)-dependent dioxygenase YbiX
VHTIADAEAQGFSATGALYPSTYRDNDRLVRDDARLAAALFECLRPALPRQLVVDGVAWRLAGLNSRFRWCRYRGGQRFCVHRDGAYVPHAGARSLLTCQLYLNDAASFEGGRTRFYAARDGSAIFGAITPEVGAAIVFDHDLWHDGEPVTAGTKYVMRTDVMYERDEASEAARAGELRGHLGYVFSLCARRDGTLASGSRDRTIRLWRVEQEVARLEGHTASVTMLAEDAGGVLWSASRDGTVRRWDGARGEIIGRHDGAVLSLVALADGRVASGGADGMISLWTSAGRAATFRAHDEWVWGLASAGGAFASGGEDGTLAIWDSATLTLAWRSPAGVAIRSLCATPRGFACGRADGTVSVVARGTSGWRVVAEARLHDGAVTALAIVGERLATAGEDGSVHVVGADLHVIATHRHPSFVRALAAHDGELATGCYDGVVRAFGL